MATIFRGVLGASPKIPRDSPHARQLGSSALALLAVVVVVAPPFNQTDWPAPKSAKSPPPAVVLAGALPLTTAQTLPFSANDWPLPRPVFESSIARKWERANDLPRQLQVTLPFDLLDWPLAKKPLPAAPETPPLNIAASRTVVVVSTPFASLDWPLAKKPLPAASDTPPLNIAATRTVVVVSTPFASLDWPLADRLLATPAEQPRNNILPRTVGPAPFAFSHWEQAKRPLPAAPQTPPLNIAALRTVVAVTKPFAQLDWSLAKKRIGTPERPPPNTIVGTPPPSPATGTFAATLADTTLAGAGGALAPVGERVSHHNSGTGGFAVGRHALGTCDMCAGVYLLRDLKPEIYNLRPTGFLVCEECWDLDNPQLQVGRVPIFDPEALRNPRTDTHLVESRELWGFNPVGNPSTNVLCQDGTVSVNGLFQFPNREATP